MLECACAFVEICMGIYGNVHAQLLEFDWTVVGMLMDICWNVCANLLHAHLLEFEWILSRSKEAETTMTPVMDSSAHIPACVKSIIRSI